MITEKYKNAIYSGVLGKIIGVYLGRPVEGWSYGQIKETFGPIYYYKNQEVGARLIVPDDDISGTFAFFRALEDCGYRSDIDSGDIGDGWLNYIVENKTILWWGGLGRSTEHTAFLRLKEGIRAPESGSVALNGRRMAEQIGAEIFIDCWALANPGNPDRAVRMAREAARVSHDGIAVEAAVFLAAMEAMAFDEKDMDRLLDKALYYVENTELKSLVRQLRAHCANARDWREVRAWIDREHGYDKYPGSCPMITNHLILLMALIMGGDDFNKACMIACSAGLDTDCNSGNVGCLNGIRLGLDGFNTGADLRGPVADRLFVVTSDGGSCISDAVLETRKIVTAAARLAGETPDVPKERMAFEYPGAVQGIVPYDGCPQAQVLTAIGNAYEDSGEYGCKISFKGLGRGVHASVAVDTCFDLRDKSKEGTSYFEVFGSPSLYSGQTICMQILVPEGLKLKMEFFIEYFNAQEALSSMASCIYPLSPGSHLVQWLVPDTRGHAIYRLGLRLTSDVRMDGYVTIKSLDWSNTPVRFAMGKAREMTPSLTPWITTATWVKSFVSSADHFYPDDVRTFAICHAGINGVATTGTSDWSDYCVRSSMIFARQSPAGLVARARGHRRYYGAVLTDGYALIYKQCNDSRVEIARSPWKYAEDVAYDMEFFVKGNCLRLYIDKKEAAVGTDTAYTCGQAGFVVDFGTVLAEGFSVCAI